MRFWNRHLQTEDGWLIAFAESHRFQLNGASDFDTKTQDMIASKS